MTRERLDAEHHERDGWLNGRLQYERQQWNDQWEKHHRVLRNENRFHVDSKLTAFEKKYGHQYCEGCDWCRRKRRGHKGGGAPVDDDCVRYAQDNAPQPGALVRCHSDETLSVSSSHPSRRNWKIRSRAMKEMKDMNLAKVSHRAHRIESELRVSSSKRLSPPGAAQNVYQEIQVRRPTGRSPEGQAEDDYLECGDVRKDTQNQGNDARSKRMPVSNGLMREFEEADGKAFAHPTTSASMADMSEGIQGLQVHDKPRHQRALVKSQSGPEGIPGAKPKASTPNIIHTQVVSIGAVPSDPHFTSANSTPTSSFGGATPKYNTTSSSINVDSPGSSFNNFSSPENMLNPSHKPSDSGSSNPDSGYHGNVYRPDSVKSASSSPPAQEPAGGAAVSNNNHAQRSAVPPPANQYYRSILTEWYGQKKVGDRGRPEAAGHTAQLHPSQLRPAQPPPLGYGQQQRMNGATMYKPPVPAPAPATPRQKPQPQVPAAQQAQLYLPGKATQV